MMLNTLKHSEKPVTVTTTLCRWKLGIVFTFVTLLFITGCGSPAGGTAENEEEDAIARTEFTDLVENFFEYAPLRAGKPSQLLIHLTELSTGEPVANAEVVLSIRKAGDSSTNDVKAKVGRVTGIYVAEVAIAEPGIYEIDFSIKNEKLTERMALKDFKVE